MKKFDHQKFVEDLRRQPWENVYFFAEDPNASYVGNLENIILRGLG